MRRDEEFIWDAAAVQFLTQQWAAGTSSSRIAAQIPADVRGRTPSRSAVLGKVNRLSLAKRRPAKKAHVALVAVEQCAGELVPMARSVGIMDLKENMCRWVWNNGEFCGGSTPEGQSYCIGHLMMIRRG